MRSRGIVTVVSLLACGSTFMACETSGPEFLVGGDTRIVEGTLTSEENLDTEFFALTSSGTVNIQATGVEGRNPETGDLITDPILGVSIGTPNAEDEEQCQLTFSKALAEGDSFSVNFREGLFCISIFRPPSSLEGAVYEYVITMTGAFS